MTAEGRIRDDDLHRAADGSIEPERWAEVEAHLAANPADAERVAFYRRLNVDLHRLYDPVLAAPVPAAWTVPPARPWWRPAPARAAAVVAWLLIGTAAGWFGRYVLTAPGPEADSLIRLAADAHRVFAVEVRHPVEVTGDQEAHLTQWLSKRLGDPVKAPDLGKAGYSLVGGRLLPAGDGAAAQFMYENTAGTRFTLFIEPSGGGETAFKFAERAGLSMVYWRTGRFAYVMAAELPRDVMLALCKEVYVQLDTPANGERG